MRHDHDVCAANRFAAEARLSGRPCTDDVINYRDCPQWSEQVRALTDGRGVDRVIEVGGPATIEQSLRAVAIGGEVTLIGFLSAANPGIDYFLLKRRGREHPLDHSRGPHRHSGARARRQRHPYPTGDRRRLRIRRRRNGVNHLAEGKLLGKLVIRIN
ncbi:zinc-binding dehydrogenase [Mycobacterium sp. 852002-40037_SCH5390672]|uniref:zinc-binding dehydrogenase n=1 Tax=Mycobacterium sp. 852002-40037_SCH5390672 TaxID=1834089 RepID=UPI000ADB413A